MTELGIMQLPRRHILIAAGLYLLFVGLYTSLVLAVNTQGLLTGEEVSVSIRDVLFLQERLQHNPMATNWGGHALYALASCFSGDALFYGRFFKAAAMALLPVMVFLFMIRTMRCRFGTAALAGLSVGLLPGITAFSWIATEYGLTVSGLLLALMLADSQASWRRVLAAALVAAAAFVYPPGLAGLPVVLGYTFKRMRRDTWTLEALTVLRSVLVVALVWCVPKLWWTNDAQLLTGGGHLDVTGFAVNVYQLIRECFVAPDSYYYFAQDPPLGHPVWAILCGCGVLFGVTRHWHRCWPLALLLLGSLGLYGISGGVAGVRRALVVVVALHLFGVFMLDQAYAGVAAMSSAPKLILARLVSTLLIVYLALLCVTYRANLNDACGQIRLPSDFGFPMASGANMPESVENIYAAAAQPTWRVPPGVDRDRLYALLLWHARTQEGDKRRETFERRLFDR